MQTLAHYLDLYWIVSIPIALVARILMNKKSAANPSPDRSENNANY
jgi:hypothetical protein